MQDPKQRVFADIPPRVLEICQTIVGAGHKAVVVGAKLLLGGTIGEALAPRAPGFDALAHDHDARGTFLDWDVATSAEPARVMALFKHHIACGLSYDNGTVVIHHDPLKIVIHHDPELAPGGTCG